MESHRNYRHWVVREVKPAAREYATEFFKHLAATLDDKAGDLLSTLETEDGRDWTHDMTVPIINATIMESMADMCMSSAAGWHDLYESGLRKHFEP